MAVGSFVAHFTLTEEEAETLRSRDAQINKKFFEIMRKAERIVADSRVLMSGEDGPTKAGCVLRHAITSYVVICEVDKYSTELKSSLWHLNNLEMDTTSSFAGVLSSSANL